MSSTNKTANYELSQFVGTDIPSILNDYNGDMRKIDTAIKAVANAEGSSASDIAGLQATVGQHTTEISGLSSTVNSLSGRVIGIEGKIPASASESNKLITAQDVADLQEEVSDMGGDVKAIQLCVPANASERNKFATMADVQSGVSNFYEHTSQYGETLNYNGNDNMSVKLADALKDFASRFGITNTIELKNNLHSFIVKLDNEVYRLSFNPGGNVQRFCCIDSHLTGIKISTFGFGINASDDSDVNTITIGNLSHRTVAIDGAGAITVNSATTEEIEAYGVELQALLFHEYE